MNLKKKKDVCKDFVDMVKDKKVQKKYFNSRTTSIKRLWRPHNYRRGLNVSFIKGIVVKEIRHYWGSLPIQVSKHTQIITINFSKNIVIQIFKDHIVSIWKQNVYKGHKEVILLEAGSLNEMTYKIERAGQHIKSLLDDAVNLLISKLTITKNGDFYNNRAEDWTRGDEYIKKLPIGVVIHEEHWKSVYDDGGIEIISKKNEDNLEKVKQHISNSILYDFAPLIAESIDKLNCSIDLNLDFEKWVKNNIHCLSDCFKFDELKGLSRAKADILYSHILDRKDLSGFIRGDKN